jgi:hypothetical protein
MAGVVSRTKRTSPDMSGCVRSVQPVNQPDRQGHTFRCVLSGLSGTRTAGKCRSQVGREQGARDDRLTFSIRNTAMTADQI